MNANQILNTAIGRLAKQGAYSYDPDSMQCCYLHPETGNKCGVGILLEGSEYSPDMEGNNIVSLVVRSLLPSRFIEHQMLLERIQAKHDQAVEIEDDFLEFLLDLANVRT